MKKIFEKYSINNKLDLKNRLVLAPMTTWSGNSDGSLSDAEVDYYAYRSTGVSMVITATTYAEESGKGFTGQFYGGDDRMIDSLKCLADTIHKGGAKAVLQIFHAGRKGNPKDMPEGVTYSASAIPGKREVNNVPKAMSHEQIATTIHSFKEATIRAYKAGFDGIEIHGANTYLLQQFFSPHSNRRDDEWGGSLKNRVKFPLAIVEACMMAKNFINDPNFIIGYRFSPEESSEPGITLDDTEFLIDCLCETDLDYLHISLGDYKATSIREEHDKSSVLKRVKDKIAGRKVLIGVGNVTDLKDAEDMLEYDVDLVAIGRQVLVDGKTVDKWSQGQAAKAYYEPENYQSEFIPKPLHDMIMKQVGWLPMKKQ